MANNTINTRIQLKYDSYENWKSANTLLLAGEIAVVEVPSAITGTETGVQNPPTILFKVGPGNFNDLDWCSARAADVYGWAKKSEADFITWVNTVVEHPAAPDLTPYLTTADIVEGATNGTIAVRGADVKIHGLGSAAYTDSAAYATSAENGANEAARAANEAAQAAQKAIDDYAAAHAGDLQAAKNYADENDANATYSINYDSTNKKIQLVGANGGETTEIDATAFIKDGMVSNVEIVDGDLVITFNTDAGKDAINVPLISLVDVYTGVDGNSVNVTVSSDNKIGAEVKTGAIKDGHIATDAAIAASKIAGLSTVATSGSYTDLSNLPTLGALAAKDDLTAAEVGAATANDITTAIEALDSSIEATEGSVLTGLTITDGKITAKTEKALHEIATTGSIYDVTEGANVSTGTDGVEYLIFYAGTASTII